MKTQKTYKSDVANVKILFPIGTRVLVPNWPVGGKVIGHHDGRAIVEVEPITFTLSELELEKSYKVHCCDDCGAKWRSDKNGDICVCGKSAIGPSN